MNSPSAPGALRAHQWLPESPWLAPLNDAHPDFAEGLARVGDVITAGSALSGSLPMLCAATIAAVKRDEDLASQYLGLAAERGLTREEAEGAGVGVLISRGVVPHRLLVAAIGTVYGHGAQASEAGTEATSTNVSDALDYFKQYFGFVPDYVELLADRAPRALEGYYLMRRAALGGTDLPAKHMELLLCAVNAAEYEARFVTIHARGARKAGATEEELVEACLTAMPFAGVASWLPAAQGILESRQEP